MAKLTVSVLINAPLEKVWDAMWNPFHIVNWNFASDDWHCPAAVWDKPKVGEIFTNTFAAKDGSFAFDFTAKYDLVEPMKHIKYTMGEMKEYFLPAGREVEVFFEKVPLWERGMSEGQGDFWIKVTEIFDAEDIHSEEMQIGGWTAILENFKRYVESC